MSGKTATRKVFQIKERDECEVNICFSVPKDKAEHIFEAEKALSKAGIHFDTGACSDENSIHRDWEFDWSLKGGAKVSFRRPKAK